VDESVDDVIRGLQDEYALDYHANLYAGRDGVIRKDGMYFRRLWWCWSGTTRPWLPRWFHGGDEWCNVPFCVVIPPFGCFLFFWRQMRTMPCEEEWAHMGDFERADYSPCGFLYGGRINHDKHHHSYLGRLCPSSRKWLRSQDS
jgi:hypothetical protein